MLGRVPSRASSRFVLLERIHRFGRCCVHASRLRSPLANLTASPSRAEPGGLRWGPCLVVARRPIGDISLCVWLAV